MTDRQKIELPDGALIWVPPGMLRSAVDDFLVEWALAVDRERDGDDALRAVLDKVRGERDELREELAKISGGFEARMASKREMRDALNQALRDLAAARDGLDSQPLTPEPVVEAHICCEHAP